MHANLGAFLQVLRDFGTILQKNTLEKRASNA